MRSNNIKEPRLIGAVLSISIISVAAAVAGKPLLEDIRYEGKLPFSIDHAREVDELDSGEPFDPEEAQLAAERLRQESIDNYHPMAKVRWRTSPRDEDGGIELVFEFDSGPEGHLKEVRFTGNSKIPQSKLEEAISVHVRSGLWARLNRQDVLRPEDLEKDKAALLAVYHRYGFMDAEIGAAILEKPPELDGFRLTWPIDKEGSVYNIGNIAFDADQLPDRAVLEDLMLLETGQTFNPKKVEFVRKRLENYFYRRGHAFATVQVELTRLEDEKQIDTEFVVDAGKRQHLREKRIIGNTTTKDRIIDREIDVQPGDVFDGAKLENAQARLELLPMFSEVEMIYDGSAESDIYDLNVHVEERKTGRIEVGYLYGEVEGSAFQFNVRDENLSLRPPFRGEALQGHLGATLGSRIVRTDVGLRNPRLGESQWSLDGGVQYEDSQYVNTAYDQRSISGQLLAGHPLGPYQFVHTGYAATGYKPYNIDEALLKEESRLDEDVSLTAWVLSWNMDTTDRMFRPSRGVRLRSGLRLGSQAMGGNTDTLQSSANASLFYNPIGEHVTNFRAGAESVQEYGQTETVPLPLRIYLGGTDDLRGFGYRSVSPLNEEGSLVGAQSAWWATLEHLVPVAKRLDIALYFDVGDVSSDAYSFTGKGPVSDWGIGVLVRSQNFPVRFDVAFPINTYDSDRINDKGEARISFSAGYKY